MQLAFGTPVSRDGSRAGVLCVPGRGYGVEDVLLELSTLHSLSVLSRADERQLSIVSGPEPAAAGTHRLSVGRFPCKPGRAVPQM